MSSSPSSTDRKIAIPLDLSDESTFVVDWALQNYLRPGDSVTLIHIRATSILYGADWGSSHFVPTSNSDDSDSSESIKQKKLEDEFEKFTEDKMRELAQPLVDAKYPIRYHIVKDHDMKERLCLEIERLGMSAVIMGSRGFGASRKDSKGSLLGSVSDYCVHHCVCPVVVIRFPATTLTTTPPIPLHNHQD